jgi:hypothetical protein
MAVEDQFKINLNQNLWALVIAYGALGVANRWGLKYLLCPSLVAAWTLTIMVIVSFGYYTWNYCIRKCYQTHTIKAKLKTKGIKN